MANQGEHLRAEDEAECFLCHQVNRFGDIVRCRFTDCTKRMHISCSFSSYGGVVAEENALYAECKQHFKLPTYCVCKRPYDGHKPMLACGSCCEWYHFNCLGLKLNSFTNKQYICEKCDTLLQSNTISNQAKLAEYKQSNIQKELRDASISEAKGPVEDLVELCTQVCGLVDTLRGHEVDDDESFTILEIEEALEVLLEFHEKATASANSDISVLCRRSAQVVTQRWEALLKRQLEAYREWEREAIELCRKLDGRLRVQDLTDDLMDGENSLRLKALKDMFGRNGLMDGLKKSDELLKLKIKNISSTSSELFEDIFNSMMALHFVNQVQSSSLFIICLFFQ